jgi:hypothetical protein
MSTSGSWDYSLTAAQTITAALEDLGVISAGGTVASADSATALVRLNLIAKQYGIPSSGLNQQPIQRQRVTLVLAKGQQSYLVGPASTDSRSSTALGRTTISATEAIGQTVISITSNTDTTSYPGSTVTMTSGDIVGIELDDGTVQWSTISGTPASTMTISDALTVAAAAGNAVWWFTSRAQRMLHVEAAVLRDENFNDTPLSVYRTAEAYALGNSSKFADADPTCVLVEPLRLNTKITLDAQPTDVTKTIVLTGWYQQEDYDSSSNDVALPQEALRFLEWELAFALSPAYRGPNGWGNDMEKQRLEARATFLNMNPETCDLYFQQDA